jgi:hypothetical protein
MSAKGTRHIQITDADETEVRSIMLKKKRSVCLLNEDEVWDEQTYVDEHGDWRTNGKGHMFGTFEGATGVLVPGKKVTKIQRKRETELEMSRQLDDGSLQFTETQIAENLENYSAAIMPPRAVGQTSDAMMEDASRRRLGQRTRLAPEVPSSAEAVAPPASSSSGQTTQSADDAESGGFGFGFSFALPTGGPAVAAANAASPARRGLKPQKPLTPGVCVV